MDEETVVEHKIEVPIPDGCGWGCSLVVFAAFAGLAVVVFRWITGI